MHMEVNKWSDISVVLRRAIGLMIIICSGADGGGSGGLVGTYSPPPPPHEKNIDSIDHVFKLHSRWPVCIHGQTAIRAMRL